MARFRVLIIDDQHEVRRVLRAGLETLGDEFEILDLPSAEEALLEMSRRPVDLLVADIRLPGISGLDLYEKIQKRGSDLKVILITGMSDPSIRLQMTEARPEAIFFKPIGMEGFLDTVQRCLASEGTHPLHSSYGKDTRDANPVSILTGRLSKVRDELESLANELEASAGERQQHPGELLALTRQIQATTNNLLGVLHTPETPDSAGDERDLMDTVMAANKAGRQLNPGIVETAPESDPQVEIEAVEALFSQPEAGGLNREDVDVFWEEITSQSQPGKTEDGGALSYEQARKLGFAPEELC